MSASLVAPSAPPFVHVTLQAPGAACRRPVPPASPTPPRAACPAPRPAPAPPDRPRPPHGGAAGREGRRPRRPAQPRAGGCGAGGPGPRPPGGGRGGRGLVPGAPRLQRPGLLQARVQPAAPQVRRAAATDCRLARPLACARAHLLLPLPPFATPEASTATTGARRWTRCTATASWCCPTASSVAHAPVAARRRTRAAAPAARAWTTGASAWCRSAGSRRVGAAVTGGGTAAEGGRRAAEPRCGHGRPSAHRAPHAPPPPAAQPVCRVLDSLSWNLLILLLTVFVVFAQDIAAAVSGAPRAQRCRWGTQRCRCPRSPASHVAMRSARQR